MSLPILDITTMTIMFHQSCHHQAHTPSPQGLATEHSASHVPAQYETVIASPLPSKVRV